ncbi:MAG: hypothetical protein R3B06_30995 [Kofleriaceae bacterium]
MADLIESAADVPIVVSVTFTFSEHPAVPLATFEGIAAADDALADALAKPYRGPGKAGFVVAWSDGESHEGRLALASVLRPVNVLRDHLTRLASWLASERFIEAVRGFASSEDVRRSQAWGRELGRRLDADLRRHAMAPARNAEPPVARRRLPAPLPPRRYAGHGVPPLAPAADVAGWLPWLSMPPTVRPDPLVLDARLSDEWRGAVQGKGPPATPAQLAGLVNWLTDALRADLPSVDSGDAAVVWEQWRTAVQRYTVRGDEHTLRFHLGIVLRNVAMAFRSPGEIWTGFCPWRRIYFDQRRLNPDPRHPPHPSPLEIDPWS